MFEVIANAIGEACSAAIDNIGNPTPVSMPTEHVDMSAAAYSTMMSASRDNYILHSNPRR